MARFSNDSEDNVSTSTWANNALQSDSSAGRLGVVRRPPGARAASRPHRSSPPVAWPLAVSSDPSRSSGRSEREIESSLGREATLYSSPSSDLQLCVVIRSDYHN